MHQQPPQTPLFASTSAAKSSQVPGVSRRVVYGVTADVTIPLSSYSRQRSLLAEHRSELGWQPDTPALRERPIGGVSEAEFRGGEADFQRRWRLVGPVRVPLNFARLVVRWTPAYGQASGGPEGWAE